MKIFRATTVCQLALLSAQTACAGKLHVHDETFQPDYILRVTYDTISPACVGRSSALINGTAPGPLLTLKEDVISWVRVYNDMKNANLTMHWHGISVNIAPFSDGTPAASQWPIAPQHFFDYEIRPNGGEAGTYFYHSHVQFQGVSASGPLVVVETGENKPVYKYDEDRILYLSEFYNRTDDDILSGLLAQPTVWSGEPDTLLLNGHAPPYSGGTQGTCGPEVIEVQPGKTYRFRFIGVSALSMININFEDHPTFDVIEADGSNSKPVSTDHVQAGPGQRYSILFKTKSKAELSKSGKKDYWIQLTNMYRPSEKLSWGLLRYKSNPSCQGFSCYQPGKTPSASLPKPPSSKIIPSATYDNDWMERKLEPLHFNNLPKASEITRRIYLSSNQILVDNHIQWRVDNNTWVERPVDQNYMTNPKKEPYLVSIYKDGPSAVPDFDRANLPANNGRDPVFNAYPAQQNETFEIILVNEAGYRGNYDVHPWHSHGGHVYDIGSGPGVYDPDKNEKLLKNYNPIFRDTTYLYQYPAKGGSNDTQYHQSGWRGWRIRVKYPGVWMIHCHSLQHMMMGMQTAWVMGDYTQLTKHNLTISNFTEYGGNSVGSAIPPAPPSSTFKGYLTYKGSAYGNSTHWPVVHHHFEN